MSFSPPRCRGNEFIVGLLTRIFRQGAIRLEETPNQPPVSIRATPDSQSGIGDEKRSV